MLFCESHDTRRTGKLDTDTDGAARSYHPGDTGIDYLANAGSPGNWYGVLTSGGSPVVQDSNDPAPGYYVSTTAMYASKARSTSQCHYVDAERLSYLVLPGSSSFRSNAGEARFARALVHASDSAPGRARAHTHTPR